MADAKGSSGGGVGRGDFVGGVPHGFQALLASVDAPAPSSALNAHQQYNYNPAGLIHQPVPMPVNVPPPYGSQLTIQTPPPPPPPTQLCIQPDGSRCQYWPGSHNVDVAAQQVPRGFADWTMYNNSGYMSVACGSSSSSNNNGYHQSSLRPCSTPAWPNYLMRNPASYSAYPPAVQYHQAPYQSNTHEINDSGFATSFRVDPPIVHAPHFPPISLESNNHSSVQFFNEATYTQEAMYTQQVKNSEDLPDMESENSDELDHTPVPQLPYFYQRHDCLSARFNCREYRIIVRKDLTNSDVGNIGRIVMPKRDAEAHLPELFERDSVILQMDDLKLPATWNFKYRFWPNNKSRMYILESTGEFVKSHGLQVGDILIIYKSPASGKYVIRGEKATVPSACLLCPECRGRGDNREDRCGFAMRLHARRI